MARRASAANFTLAYFDTAVPVPHHSQSSSSSSLKRRPPTPSRHRALEAHQTSALEEGDREWQQGSDSQRRLQPCLPSMAPGGGRTPALERAWPDIRLDNAPFPASLFSA